MCPSLVSHCFFTSWVWGSWTPYSKVYFGWAWKGNRIKSILSLFNKELQKKKPFPLFFQSSKLICYRLDNMSISWNRVCRHLLIVIRVEAKCSDRLILNGWNDPWLKANVHYINKVKDLRVVPHDGEGKLQQQRRR